MQTLFPYHEILIQLCEVVKSFKNMKLNFKIEILAAQNDHWSEIFASQTTKMITDDWPTVILNFVNWKLFVVTLFLSTTRSMINHFGWCSGYTERNF